VPSSSITLLNTNPQCENPEIEVLGPASLQTSGVRSDGSQGIGLEGSTPTARWIRSGARQFYQAARRGKTCLRDFWEWGRCKRVTLPSLEQLVECLPPLSRAADKPNDAEAPIFLLSTGWRTGSTLLQRALVTDPHLLLWGEPLGDMALVSRVAEMLCSTAKFAWLEKFRIRDDFPPASMATSWIATLYPPGDDFRSALRSLFDRWLAEPARQRGFARWGFKEVRLGATEASLLSWLYPQAKFLILSRHPYDCYRSLSDSGWKHVFYRFPDIPINSAAAFARHWNRLAESWSQLPAGFPFLHIKYEDLVGGRFDFGQLQSWLDVDIRPDVALSASIGHTAVRGRLDWHERLIIGREAARGMQILGYSR
jgi:hypothetical protein